jgi:hypothetical protein
VNNKELNMKENNKASHTGNQTPHGEIESGNAKKYLFDNPRNVKILLRSFFSSLLVLLVVELFIHKHPHFRWEGWHEFYAVFGFVACVALVLAAKYILRPLVKRGEDYYD